MNKINLVIISLLVISCNLDQNKVDREKIKQEISDREIKRLSDADIQDAAFLLGEKIVSEAEVVVNNKLAPIINEAPVDSTKGGWIIFPPCSAFNDFLLKSYNDSIQHDVTLISNQYFDLTGPVADKAKLLLEAYQYNDEHQLPMENNVQKVEPEFILFTKPIINKDTSCIPCLKGVTNRDIVDYKKPEDSLQFCGMWLVKISKKALIKSL